MKLDPTRPGCPVCNAHPGEDCDQGMRNVVYHSSSEWNVHKDRYLLAQVQQFGYDATTWRAT